MGQAGGLRHKLVPLQIPQLSSLVPENGIPSHPGKNQHDRGRKERTEARFSVSVADTTDIDDGLVLDEGTVTTVPKSTIRSSSSWIVARTFEAGARRISKACIGGAT